MHISLRKISSPFYLTVSPLGQEAPDIFAAPTQRKRLSLAPQLPFDSYTNKDTQENYQPPSQAYNKYQHRLVLPDSEDEDNEDAEDMEENDMMDYNEDDHFSNLNVSDHTSMIIFNNDDYSKFPVQIYCYSNPAWGFSAASGRLGQHAPKHLTCIKMQAPWHCYQH